MKTQRGAPMQSEDFLFEEKPVFDWNRVPVGTVSETRRDPKTREARQLVLTLTPEAKTRLGTSATTMELPAKLVSGLRRDGVTLDRSITELRQIDRFESILKK